ncbi:MAG: PhoH family protein [Planctomycetota bacterium]|nr:PhoH family protein [Planctomycetota bacterium]
MSRKLSTETFLAPHQIPEPVVITQPTQPTSGPSRSPLNAARKPAKDEPRTAVKTFVLDTNVVLHNPKAIFVFQENNIVIPFAVLEELDRFKTSNDDLGRNARAVIRYLDALRDQGRLIDGVRLGNGEPALKEATGLNPTGMLRIDITEHQRPPALKEDLADNRIIAVAWSMHQKGDRVVFVSKDLNARIKSDALGIRTEDFENQKVDADSLYTGFLTAQVEGSLIDELYSERMLPLEKLARELMGQVETPELEPNQFVVLIDRADPGHTGLARRLTETDHVIPATGPRKPTFGIMGRNVQQTMALDLLLDDEIKLLTLIGSAGTGKTLLAVAAGMAKVFNEERYEKLLVARPIMPLGRDIGYLPGDKDEKLTAWMQPIFDNLAYLLSTRGAHMQAAESHSTEQRIQKLIADGRLVLEPLTYIRGRSIPHQFIIVDEAQNLTPHEVKTIISRVGEGTKIVFTGDLGQIDNPYLDSSSNGLAYAVEKMKGIGIVGHITLTKSERSELASLATSRL